MIEKARMESNNSLTDIICGANMTEILKFVSPEGNGESFIEQYNSLCDGQMPENTSWLEQLLLD